MTARPPHNRTSAGKTAHRAAQDGLTLVELMISIALGLFVVLAATTLFLSAKGSYSTQDENARIQDTGRFATEIITRAVRQTAFENWDRVEAPIVSTSVISANVAGLDAQSLKGTTEGIASPVTPAINGSDVLALRFFGAGAGVHGDGTVVDCAGFGVPAATSQEAADAERGWSVFYVGKDANGESELYCKYRGVTDDGDSSGWKSEAIARGVDAFQVLYGVDTDADELPNQFITATAIDALDSNLVLEGDTAEARVADKNRKTNWKKVVVIKVALLLHGSQHVRSDALTAEYDLFGKDYSEAHAATDIGTRIKEAALPKTSRNRVRKIFSSTIQLRNRAAGGAA